MKAVVFCVVVALFHAIHGTEANLCLSQINSPAVYKRFIRRVRLQLSFQTLPIYGITVLRHSVPNYNRFIFINITGRSDEYITLAVDVEDGGLMAYHARGRDSYFFPNAPQLAFLTLFYDTHRTLLNFNNTFPSLENAAGTTRQRILLGADPFESAISNMFHYRRELVPESLLVILQMVIEASKFKFIEQSVANSIRDGESFTPDLAILSLEDNWSELSLQIQASSSLQGVFGRAFDLYGSNNEVIQVDSIYYPIILANIALIRYHCEPASFFSDGIEPMGRSYIKMPSNEANACNLQPRTTSISGRDGFCANLSSALAKDGSSIILSPCEQQEESQQWTIYPDNTIRSLGKCLTTRTSRYGNTLGIYDCSKVTQKEITWRVSIGGWILNPGYDLVVTANGASRSTKLVVETNKYNAGQCWRVGIYVKPIIASIIGLNEMCLEATNEYKSIWLENCVKNRNEQSWAIYGDGTIRPMNNRLLCVTSFATSIIKLITIRRCDGLDNQRWFFSVAGTIFNIKYETWPMAVAESNVNLKKIVLNPPNAKANQQWVLFY